MHNEAEQRGSCRCLGLGDVARRIGLCVAAVSCAPADMINKRNDGACRSLRRRAAEREF